LEKAEGWLLDKLKETIFEKCDGIVAAGQLANLGRELHRLTDRGREKKTWKTRHPGTESNWNCGAKSDYTITWTIEPF
jgi:hypothetical protein